VFYVDVPLVGHRIHDENQSLVADKNLMEILGPYVLNLQFKELGRVYDHHIIEDKFNKSVPRLASLALRYSLRAAKRGDTNLAKQYWHLSQALNPEIGLTAECFTLGSFLFSKIPAPITVLENIDLSIDFQRKVTYQPDEPYVKINDVFL
jgi:hypothetical protein